MYTVLHVAFEYTYGIGGLKSVMNGLLPALQKNNVSTCVITPFYDFLQNTNLKLEELATIKHCYKKTLHTSIVFHIKPKEVCPITSIDHYLIKPNIDSPVAQIFDIGDQFNIYKAFNHSEPQNRIEYFNGAISSFVRIFHPKIPKFDIIHTHCWHTALSVCLIKEFEQLNWVEIGNSELELQIIPKIISSIHMLSKEQGLLVGKNDIVETLTSVGLPLDTRFLINHQNLNQMHLGLQYTDQVVMVSKSVANDAITGKDYGLGEIFNTLNQLERLNWINNGITINKFSPTLIENLGQYALNIGNAFSITEQKKNIKKFLSCKYKNLNPNEDSIWYLYLGRFGKEKGIDMLPHALDAILECNGSLIVMGCYITEKDSSPNSIIGNIINNLKNKKNVVIIDNNYEQDLIGKFFRTACEFTLVPSHVEACGLIAMEAMNNCSIPITSDVQGLPDTVISFWENQQNEISGTGFTYHDDPDCGTDNIKTIIKTANSKYISWKQENKLNLLLYRLHNESIKFDWQATPASNYIKLYEKTLKEQSIFAPHIIKSYFKIKVLHIALEYKEATLGGLGTVTTQLVNAQNQFQHGNSFEASIITPCYSIFAKHYNYAVYFTTVLHTYNNEKVESGIYLINTGNNKHFLIQSSPKYNKLFNIDAANKIYSSDQDFLERIKYFNSAAAAFVATQFEMQDSVIQLHGWPTSLSAVILREIYKLNSIKIIYTVHVNNKDRGTYHGDKLLGIGLPFSNKLYILKKLGIDYSDYIVGVSPSVLTECSLVWEPNIGVPHNQTHEVATSFLQAKYIKRSVGILNGIDYQEYCKIKKLIHNSSEITNLTISKNKIKQQLAKQLSGKFSSWKINPDLPVILYIGRFSKEKGVETFGQIISAINQRAIFFALGKGFNKEVFKLIMQYSRQKNNIFITLSALEQEQYGDMMRAAADFTFVPSHEEACGLVAMEGFANGSICITSGVGGLKDFISQFEYNNKFSSGNGFFYQDNDENSLLQTITFALDLWQIIPSNEKSIIHNRIIQESEKFDWLAENGAIQKYLELFKYLLAFQEPKAYHTPLRLQI